MSDPTIDSTDNAAPATDTRSNTLLELTRGTPGALILLLLVFVCYAWGARSGYVWDDDAYVSQNTTLRTFGGLSRIWTEIGATPQYYPMTFTSFWLEVQTFGLAPGVSHLINAVLHAGSVLLLWQVLRRLAVPGAWVAAAIFAVHPINVESVAWISERKNTLSLLLALSSVWMYLRYAGLGTDTRREGPGEGIKVALPTDPSRLYRLFLALFVLALLSKTVVAVVPVMLAVVIWWKRGRVTAKDALSLLPALVLGAIAGGVTSYIEHSPDFVGANGAEWDVTPIGRLMLVGQTSLFYAYKVLWPFSIHHFQPQDKDPLTTIPFFPTSFSYERWTLNAASPWQWLPLGVLVVTLGGLLRGVRSYGRGPLATVLLFLIGLLPVLGLVSVYPMRFSWVADHFAYLGAIGLIVGATAGIAIAVRRRPDWLPTAGVMTALLIASLTAISFWHALAFKDNLSLWGRTLQQNPRSWIAALNYGGTLMEKAQTDSRKLALRGDDEAATALREDFLHKAELWLNEGVRLNPNAYEGYFSLGVLALQRGELDLALSQYKKAEETATAMRATGYRKPAFYTGDILIAQGKVDEALELFKKLETLEPKIGRRAGGLFAQIRTRHGDVLRSRIKGKIGTDLDPADRDLLGQAVDQYTAAIDVGPDAVTPKLRLAGILADTGYYRDALQQVGDVFRVEPDNPEAKLITARVAVSQSLYDAAAVQLTNLLQLYPQYLPAHIELAKVFKAMGRMDDAKLEAKRAMEIAPNQPEARQVAAEIFGASTQPASQPASQRAK